VLPIKGALAAANHTVIQAKRLLLAMFVGSKKNKRKTFIAVLIRSFADTAANRCATCP
jgi:hypothetical protein